MTLVPASSHGGGGSSTTVQDADPGGAAGAGWLNTTDPGHGIPSNVRPFLVRNAAGTGWDEVQTIHRDAGGNVRGFITFSDDGMVMQLLTAAGVILGEWYFFHSGANGYSQWAVGGTAGTAKIDLDSAGAIRLTPAGFGSAPWDISADGAEEFHQLTATPPASADAGFRRHWYDDTTGAPKMLVSQADSANTKFSGYSVGALLKTSGALSTVAPVSGTAFTLAGASDTFLVVPVTFNPGAATTATCTVALSPDNVTFSTLGVETVPAGVALDGTVHLISIRVPAAWYVKLTVNAQAVLGTGTYF